MNGTSDSNRPVVPDGLRRETPGEGSPREKLDRTTEGPKPASSGLVWAVVGGAAMLLGTDLGCAFVAYGIGLTLSEGARAKWSTFVVSTLAAVLACVLADPTQIPYAVVGCLAAALFSGCGTKWDLSAGRKCLSVALIAVSLAGIAAVAAYLDGSSLPAEVESTIVEYGKEARSSVGSDPDLNSQIDEIQATARMYWPATYLAPAIIEAACAQLGALVAARRCGTRSGHTFAEFDEPVWVCVVFVVGVLASLMSPLASAWSSQVKMIGENVLTVARVALTLQGLALLAWLYKSSRIGPFTRGFLMVIAVYLEFTFLIMSVLGLVDIVAANFRGLPRKRGGRADAPAREGKESA